MNGRITPDVKALHRASDEIRDDVNVATRGVRPFLIAVADFLGECGDDLAEAAGNYGWCNGEMVRAALAMNDSQYIAAMHPGVALLIADQWDAIADDIETAESDAEVGEVVERGTAGVGVLVLGRLFSPRPVWTAAYRAALAILGEA